MSGRRCRPRMHLLSRRRLLRPSQTRQQNSDGDPVALIDNQADRFKKQRGMGAAYVRMKSHGYWSGQADICRMNGDLEGELRYRAHAAQALTASRSDGP